MKITMNKWENITIANYTNALLNTTYSYSITFKII